jgi:hypothetical protein
MRKEPTWNYNSLLWFKSQGKTGQAHKIMNTASNLEKSLVLNKYNFTLNKEFFFLRTDTENGESIFPLK